MSCFHCCLFWEREGNINTKQFQCPIALRILLNSPVVCLCGHHTGQAAFHSLDSSTHGPGTRSAGHTLHCSTLSGVNKRRAVRIKSGVARVTLCHPCSFVKKAACAFPGRRTRGQPGEGEAPSPPSTSLPPPCQLSKRPLHPCFVILFTGRH